MVGFKRLSPDEAQDHRDLVHSYRMDALLTVKTLFNDWEPWSQSFLINHGANLASAAASLSGLVYGHHLTRILPGIAR